jgi:hypothetical protein
MGSNLWAPLPGFEPYVPTVTDAFDSVIDRRATELATYLRGELQEIGRSPAKESQTMVALPDGRIGQLTQRATDEWELVIHLGRDFYKVVTARTRAQALDGTV